MSLLLHRLTVLALLVTGLLLLALLTLGLGLQLGRWRTAKLWHHALYLAVLLGTVAALALAWQLGAAWAWLVPALVLLGLMPLTKAGRADHWRLALACALAYGVGVWQVLPSL